MCSILFCNKTCFQNFHTAKSIYLTSTKTKLRLINSLTYSEETFLRENLRLINDIQYNMVQNTYCVLYENQILWMMPDGSEKESIALPMTVKSS